MTKFYFIFLSCIPSCVRLQGIDFPFSSFPACIRGPGKNGWCRDIKDCPPLLDDVSNIKGSTCGFRGSRPLVCCPLRVDLLEQNNEKGVVLLSEKITSPILSMGCGRREAVESEFPATFVRKRRSDHASTTLPSTTSTKFKKAWPWMIMLLENKDTFRKSFICNGVLINENYVLTAAQCVVNRTNLFVRLTDNQINSKIFNAESLEKFEDFKVEYFVFHPKYKADQKYYGVALLKLSKTMNGVVPICLPFSSEPQEDINETVTLVGWARSYADEQPLPLLLEDYATVLDLSVCIESYSHLGDNKESFPEELNKDSILCLDYDGTKDFCNIVSGGAVMHFRQSDDTFTLTGLTSTDYGCRSNNFPQIYTSIQNQETMKWISDVAFK